MIGSFHPRSRHAARVSARAPHLHGGVGGGRLGGQHLCGAAACLRRESSRGGWQMGSGEEGRRGGGAAGREPGGRAGTGAADEGGGGERHTQRRGCCESARVHIAAEITVRGQGGAAEIKPGGRAPEGGGGGAPSLPNASVASAQVWNAEGGLAPHRCEKRGATGGDPPALLIEASVGWNHLSIMCLIKVVSFIVGRA